jgi:hypothetical protein
MLNKADGENIILGMHQVRNYEEFSCTDNSLQCYNENEVCEEAVVEHIAAKHQKAPDQETDDDDDDIEPERVTNQDARKRIAGLRLHFMQEANEGSLIICTRNLY